MRKKIQKIKKTKKRFNQKRKLSKKDDKKNIDKKNIDKKLAYKTPETDYQILTQRYRLKETFGSAINKEVQRIQKKTMNNEGRVNLRKLPTITIDGEDAKDFDDAISIIKEKNGFRLWVHIADVSHFVATNSAIDKQAFKRGTSVYLIDRVIPMLPFELSNNICSLKGNCDRLTFTCEMEIDSKGFIKNYDFYLSKIHNDQRCTYSKVQSWLDDKDTLPENLPWIKDFLTIAKELAIILNKKRILEGSVEIESTELNIQLENTGMVKKVHPQKRLFSENIIEEFMLSANKCAADLMQKNAKGLYRVHEPPKEEKIGSFYDYLKRQGLTEKVEGVTNPLEIQGRNYFNTLIQSIENPQKKKLFSFLLLISMNQAEYSVANKGHYGLAFKKYTHFTSPIRRYPDLQVHRIIKKIKGFYQKPISNHLNEIAKQSSIMERKAIEAEREYRKLKCIRFMRDKKNQEFAAIIIGLMNRGVFVQLTAIGVEGFISRGNFTTALSFDRNRQVFINRQNEIKLEMGTELKVKLIKVNPGKLKMDFIPI